MDNHSRIQRDAKRGWTQARSLKVFPASAQVLADRGIFALHPTVKAMVKGATAEAVITLHEHMPAVEVGDVLVPLHDHAGELRALRLWPMGQGRGPRRAMVGDWAHTGEGLVFASPAALDAMQHGFRGRALVIAEGEPDTLSCAQGWPDVPVVGICGERMWGEALGAWASGAAEVIIRTDDDAAGERYAAKIARSLRPHVPVLRYRAERKLQRADGREDAEDQNDLVMLGRLGGPGHPPQSGCVPYEPPPAPAVQAELPAPKAGSEEGVRRGGDDDGLWRLGRAALWWCARWERTLAEARQPGGTHGEGGWASHALTDLRAAQGLGRTQLEDWARRTAEGGTEEGRDLARRVSFALSALNPAAMEGELGTAAQAGARDAESRADRAAEVKGLTRKAARQPMTEAEIVRPVDAAPAPTKKKTTKRKTQPAPTPAATAEPAPANNDGEEGEPMGGAANVRVLAKWATWDWEREVDRQPWPRLPSHLELAQRVIKRLSPPGDDGPVGDEDSLWRYDINTGLWKEITKSATTRIMSAWDGAPTEDGKRTVMVNGNTPEAARSLAFDLCEQQGFFARSPCGVMLRDGFLTVDPIRRTVEIVPPAPEHRARHRLDAMPTDKRGDLLSLYLSTAHEGADAEDKVRLMGEVLFVALTGLGTTYKKAVLAYGDSGGGKSQWLDLLGGLVPESATATIKPQSMGLDYHCAGLAGKTLNRVSELGGDEILKEAEFKGIVHGEPQQARHPSGRVFTMVPRALHVFASNSLPPAPGATGAYWDRWIIMGFLKRFTTKDDRTLLAGSVADIGKRILAEEMDGLLGWVIECGRDLVARGHYTIPATSRDLLAEWKGSGDNVAGWLGERAKPHEKDEPRRRWTRRTAAYRDYVEWARNLGFGTLNATNFKLRLRALGVRCITYCGIDHYALDLLGDLAPSGDDSPF